VVRLIRPADPIGRTRRQVVRIGGLRIILEGLVVRAVVRDYASRQIR
jgi:hypothetical protein